MALCRKSAVAMPSMHFQCCVSLTSTWFFAGFVGSRAKRCYDRTAVRATLSSEITLARRARDSKGLKLFQLDRLLENPNNVTPNLEMLNVVKDINEAMAKAKADAT